MDVQQYSQYRPKPLYDLLDGLYGAFDINRKVYGLNKVSSWRQNLQIGDTQRFCHDYISN